MQWKNFVFYCSYEFFLLFFVLPSFLDQQFYWGYKVWKITRARKTTSAARNGRLIEAPRVQPASVVEAFNQNLGSFLEEYFAIDLNEW